MELGDVRHSLQGRLKSWTANARSGRTEGIQLTLQSGVGEILVLGCPCRMISAFVSFVWCWWVLIITHIDSGSLGYVGVRFVLTLLSKSCICAAPPLKLFDLPGLDTRASSDDSLVSFQQFCTSTVYSVAPMSCLRYLNKCTALKMFTSNYHHNYVSTGARIC